MEGMRGVKPGSEVLSMLKVSCVGMHGSRDQKTHLQEIQRCVHAFSSNRIRCLKGGCWVRMAWLQPQMSNEITSKKFLGFGEKGP